MKDEVVIKLVEEGDEYQQAIKFISKVAFQWHRCRPPETKGRLFVAFRGEKIIGTISLDFVGEAQLFPLEEIYEFDEKQAPFPFKRDMIVQFGRWMCIEKNISHLLFYEALVFSRTHGKQYVLSEAKSFIVDRLVEFGFKCYPLHGAQLIKEKISQKNKKYYEERPHPILFMMEIKQMIRDLGLFIENKKR